MEIQQDKADSRFVIKRNGRKERVHYEKITHRITKFCYGLDLKYVKPVELAQGVISELFSGIETWQLDELAAERAASKTTTHPDYGRLAARIAVSNLHKRTQKSFYHTMRALYLCVEKKSRRSCPMLSESVYQWIVENREELEGTLVHDRDFDLDYSGIKTLERSFLLKVDGRVKERPQHMFLRVACGIHSGDLQAVQQTYQLLSTGKVMHATPTLLQAGTPRPQMSSCSLLTIKDDSVKGIYSALSDCALLLQGAGEVGLSVTRVRAAGSCVSTGLVPVVKLFQDTCSYVDQGADETTKGAFSLHLEAWHGDIVHVLVRMLALASEENKEKRRDLRYCLCLPDLFMKRVKKDQPWTLFCPTEAPALLETWGEEFEKAYVQYENQGVASSVMPARKLFDMICAAQIETRATEILYTRTFSSSEVTVCHLASVALPKFVDSKARKFDHAALAEAVSVVCRDLNQIIDRTHSPVPQAEHSNLRHRAIALSAQGLADAFFLMKYPFESEEARQLNMEIFETIHFAALRTSMKLAKIKGVHPSYKERSAELLPFFVRETKKDRSEAKTEKSSTGEQSQEKSEHKKQGSGRYNWDALKEDIKFYGLRNSFTVPFLAPAARIFVNSEGVAPFSENGHARNTNPHLASELVKRKLWDQDLQEELATHRGSVQNVSRVPAELKPLFKTSQEISPDRMLQMAQDRGAFMAQSPALPVCTSDPHSMIKQCHMKMWEKGMKTVLCLQKD